MNPLLVLKRDVSKEVSDLIEAFAALPKGTLISYEEIESTARCHRNVYPWHKIIAKFRKALMEHYDRWCITSNGVGLRFATDEERLKSEADRLEKHATRKLNKAAKCVGGISPESLTGEQRLFQQARLKQLADSKQLHKTHSVQRQTWLASPQTLPRIKNEQGGTT